MGKNTIKTRKDEGEFDFTIMEELGYESAMPYLQAKYGINTAKKVEKALRKLDDNEMRQIEPGQNMGTYFHKK